MSFRIPSQIMEKTWVAVGVGVVTTGYGIYSKARANKKQKDALAKRKAYTTQDETYQILNALENRSQGDVATRDFQQQQIDSSFAEGLDTAELLGADANDLSAMFQQKMQGILQVGQQFHASNMEAFGKYIGGLDMVAKSKDAEYGSEQNIIKDQIQAAAQQGADANATINSGINIALAGYSASQSNKLYQDYLKTQTNTATAGGNTGFSNSTITESIPELTGTVQSTTVAPQRTVGVGTQTIVQPTANNNSMVNDAGFLQWLQTNGIGTKI